MEDKKINIFWMRRDMRLEDNTALYHAALDKKPILILFIMDTEILDELPEDDRRVSFIYDTLERLNKQLDNYGTSIQVSYGVPSEVFHTIFANNKINAIYAGRDYEPYAKERDKSIEKLAEKHGVQLNLYKDHVLMHQDEVLKSDGTPYLVYTPYMKLWKERVKSRIESGKIVDSFFLKPYNYELGSIDFVTPEVTLRALTDYGFKAANYDVPEMNIDDNTIKNYEKNRNFPARNGTSRLSVHLRFGTMSVRKIACDTANLNEQFLNELIWRDFYSMILDHYPKVVHMEFHEKYSSIPWRNNEEEFEAWKEGRTGFALVDAGMRQLNESGFMHNRVRMLVACILTKHLLIDWRWGEAYFAEKLMDYDLASNNGGWQWAAGTGTDAAPYFRIFNPHTQIKKFDPNYEYIKKWVPEFSEDNYIDPIIPHKEGRERALAVYKEAIN